MGAWSADDRDPRGAHRATGLAKAVGDRRGDFEGTVGVGAEPDHAVRGLDDEFESRGFRHQPDSSELSAGLRAPAEQSEVQPARCADPDLGHGSIAPISTPRRRAPSPVSYCGHSALLKTRPNRERYQFDNHSGIVSYRLYQHCRRIISNGETFLTLSLIVVFRVGRWS